ncbi:MAG: hypothetical protein Q9227_003049 [Pyrenula ochraceoflavens]
MWSFKKALFAAAAVLTFFILLRNSHTTPRVPSIKTSSDSSKAATTSDSSRINTSPRSKRPIDQVSLSEIAGKPLRDRLRYYYPYDLEQKFPAYIWQTWKYTPASGDFGESLRPLEASWSEKHPGFVHEVVTDDAAKNLIKYLYAGIPEVIDAFISMPLPVLKADFFRYLILYARGGIYSDIDTSALKAATEWLPEDFDRSTVGLITGVEADPDRPDWSEWYSRRLQLCQWTIQSKPGHPVLRDAVAFITEEALRMKKLNILKEGKMDKTVMEFTGPAVWTDSVFRYFNNPDYFEGAGGRLNVTAMNFTGLTTQKKIGDVVVLPITSFSPGVGQMGAKEQDDPMAFVKHEFEGSWKPAGEKNGIH